MPDSDSEHFESADEDILEEVANKDSSSTLSRQLNDETNKATGSSSWKSWGAFEMISSASKSVANVTTKMTQTLSTAIESINIPEPEEMAKRHVDHKSIDHNEVTESNTKVRKEQEEGSVFKLDSLLSNVSLISSKVVTGGLDTLEGIGKKTMNILQDTDPNIKNKLRSINSSNKPNLSEILKEAKNSDSSYESESNVGKPPLLSFEHLLEEFSGLVYYEAIEILSKQSKMKIELLLKPLTGKLLHEMEETLKEVHELCEPPDSDSVNENLTTITLNDELTKAVEDLNFQVNFKDITNYSLQLDEYLKESGEDDCSGLYNKSVEVLAKLCALSLNNYQKLAELMLSLDHRSTADEVDAVILLTKIYFGLFNHVATKFSQKISTAKGSSLSGSNMSMEVFVECSNAVSYVKRTFDMFIPILQIGAL